MGFFYFWQVMKKEDVFIYTAPRPLWHRIIAAVLFTFCIYILYRFYQIASWELVEKRPKAIASPLQLAIISGGFGVYFSLRFDYHFDFEKRRYKKLFCLGPLRYGIWKAFQNLEYISVFAKDEETIELNLWYDNNNHFTIAMFDESAPALTAGEVVAKKLGIDLLDAATDPQDSQWVDYD